MATEALHLPRRHTITIRLPHRLRVLLRAVRMARARRSVKLYRQLADSDERVRKDLLVATGNPNHRGWLAAIATMGAGNY